MVEQDQNSAPGDKTPDVKPPRSSRSRGGGGGGQPRAVQISKALSRLLRHQATNAGITLSASGYAPVPQVLAWGPLRSLGVTFQEVREVVRDNEKQRFGLAPREGVEEGGAASDDRAEDWLIRANQGHSIKMDSSAEGLMNEEVSPALGNVPPRVVHGTYFAFWRSILRDGGLKPMGRNHVHCSAGVPGEEEGVKSGMRADAELLIEIDVERSIREGGLRWWRSDNGVLLTEGGEDGLVRTAWFKLVEGRKAGVGTLMVDGEWTADLPESLKFSLPRGKGGRGGSGGRGRGGRGGA